MNLLTASLREGRADLPSADGSGRIPAPDRIRYPRRHPPAGPDATEAGSQGLSVSGSVVVVETLGSETLVYVESDGETIIGSAPRRQMPRLGERLTLHAPADRLYFFDATTEKALTAR